jgi:hypothetical protein
LPKAIVCLQPVSRDPQLDLILAQAPKKNCAPKLARAKIVKCKVSTASKQIWRDRRGICALISQTHQWRTFVNTHSTAKRSSKHADFSTLFSAFLILVVIPGAFTAVLPRMTVEMQRDASGVSVQTCTHALLFVPYYCQHEQAVTRVVLELHKGERVPYNPQLREGMNQAHRRGQTADNAVIYFFGSGEGASVMIAPERMDDVQAQAQTFIDSKVGNTLSFSFFAHSAGLYVGGLLSLFALLFPPLLGLAIVRRVLDRPYWPFDGF